ncbi:LAFE_0C13190g1_1 [Lachancea fermentati]|uniref:LAFE_0C13190g1_1 n=1 Tax=Lachancea fermentati TaxID=4955 RepID=A0A1G4MAH6_LACFM|nr:LAFE_0C13190g1_1 [Lachancea fermentati]
MDLATVIGGYEPHVTDPHPTKHYSAIPKAPTRPGTVYLATYSISKDTLVERTPSHVIPSLPSPSRPTTPSLSFSLRRVFSRNGSRRTPRPESRHHRFRRWLNARDPPHSNFSRGNFSHGNFPQGNLSQDNVSASAWSSVSGSVQPPRAGLGVAASAATADAAEFASADAESDFESDTDEELDRNSGASGPDAYVTPQSRKLECLRRFRRRLQRDHVLAPAKLAQPARRALTLTDRYLGSEESIERCLRDMDAMPFALAGNDGSDGDGGAST